MGMTIDKHTCEPKPMNKEEIVNTLKTMVFGVQAFERFNAKERETLDKAWNLIDQYENHLKADKVVMLTELQSEIEEIPSLTDLCDYAIDTCISRHYVYDLIEQKINALKEIKDVR